MFSSRKVFLLALLILFLSGLNYSIAGITYKWVDENGKVHFSDRPPNDPNIKPEIIQQNKNSEVKNEINIVSEKPPEKRINPLEHTAKSTFTIKGSNSSCIIVLLRQH